ncbi:MAG TPA: ribonuclease HII [Deltaproteobacteria bacterium]|nr:ribonuclease HII [Deltaproteobacteria bacterium]
MKILGIDEAGRGCVLGDLVIAGFLAEAPDDELLRKAGAADSKALSAKRRELARSRLADLGQAILRRITPEQIDGGNLNTLEESAIVEIVTETRPDVVLLDALGHPRTLPALRARLQRQLPEDLEPRWTIEPKADATYPMVGAASIFAKTARDGALQSLVDAFGELGSGYPSDPKTKAWLTAWARTGAPWPHFVRTRWATITELAQQALL